MFSSHVKTERGAEQTSIAFITCILSKHSSSKHRTNKNENIIVPRVGRDARKSRATLKLRRYSL